MHDLLRTPTDQLVTPAELCTFLDRESVNTHMAMLAIGAATAFVQSLVGEQIAYTYPPGSPELELARTAVLKLAKDVYSSIIVAYEEAYEQAKETMDLSSHWKAALQLQYDCRARLLAAAQS